MRSEWKGLAIAAAIGAGLAVLVGVAMVAAWAPHP